MAGTNLNFPFDEEIFNYQWKNEPDVVLTNMLESGAVVNDPEVARLIANGSNFFVTPYYDVLGGDEENYNGVDDMTATATEGGNYSGVVYGRMKAWKATSFIKDFNSGADPMQQIVSGVAKYWQKKRQARLIGVLDALFGISGDTDWDLHTTNIATTGSSVEDANKIAETTINEAIVKANGDHATDYTLAIMHSVVAGRLANLQLLNFLKYTDASGIERALPIGQINGLTVIVNDNVTVEDSGTASGEKEYSTYLLGQGAIRYAQAPVEVPAEMDRNPAVAGGQDMLYTRVREAMVPYGFNFEGDYSTDVAVPDTELLVSASYSREMPHKAINLARVVTNG